jgi:hypothetical protein
LLPIACQARCSWGVQTDGTHWYPYCQLELWLVIVPLLAGLWTTLLNSSDLVPSDFHLFGCLKKHLVGKRFATDGSVKQAVSWLQALDTSFFYTGLQALVPWWDRHLNVSADYMEVCLPYATTHVPCMHQSQYKVLSNSVLYLNFWNYFLLL